MSTSIEAQPYMQNMEAAVAPMPFEDQLQPTPEAPITTLDRIKDFGRTAINRFNTLTDHLPTPSRRATAVVASTAAFAVGTAAAETTPAAAKEIATTAANSRKKVAIVRGAINTKSPSYQSALAEYKSDPLRDPNRKFAGDSYTENMFMALPLSVKQEFTKQAFKYVSKGKDSPKINVGFYTTPPQYWDLMSRRSARITAEVKQPGNRPPKQVGQTVYYRDGMREILEAYGLKNTKNKAFGYKSVAIKGVGNLCKQGKRSNTEVRVKILLRSTAIRSQRWQHDQFSLGGKSTSDMPNAFGIYPGHFKKICK